MVEDKCLWIVNAAENCNELRMRDVVRRDTDVAEGV